ncbi:hypothetical protein HYV88_02235 [Candidatus Woesearchaeota archaeon]|nr:hypothetical protein [Candidatus Woesearchaeota archaeon]
MKWKKFFKPRWWISISLIVLTFIELSLAKNILSKVGSRPTNIEGIIIVAIFLVPLIWLYLLISLIMYLIKRKK